MESENSKRKTSIEEFGKYIDYQNKLLIDEKAKEYSLVLGNDESNMITLDKFISLNGSTTSPITMFTHEVKDNSSSKLKIKEYRSPFLSNKGSRKVSDSVFSTSCKSKKVKVENPFKSPLFKKKLEFNEDSAE